MVAWFNTIVQISKSSSMWSQRFRHDLLLALNGKRRRPTQGISLPAVLALRKSALLWESAGALFES